MNFIEFKKLLNTVHSNPLPGLFSLLKMAPAQRFDKTKSPLKVKTNHKTASVMILFYPNDENQTYFVLIKRKENTGVHSKQISFPGGKRDETDASNWDVALRETEEEIGVSKNSVTKILSTTPTYIPPSNFMVYPFIATCVTRPQFTLQEDEVEEILEVSFEDLMNPKNTTTAYIKANYMKEQKVPQFIFNNHVVWGATAMILQEVKDLLTTNDINL